MMKKPIKLGIVGLGRAGRGMHLAELKGKLGDMFEIVAACDIEEDRREQIKEEFGCKIYNKIEDIVKDPDIELLDIATRSNDHYTHAKTALDAGMTIFLEKPISETYEEAKQLVEIAAKYPDRRLYVRHNRRFEPKFRQVMDIINSGILGDVYYVKRSVDSYDIRRDWQTLSQYGGGQLLNWGPHLVDQGLRFAGGDYTELYADIRHVVAAGDCEDVVHATMNGVNGRMVEIQISGASALKLPEYIVYGSRGALIDKNDGKFSLRYVDPAFELPRPQASIDTPAGAKFGPAIPIPFIEEEREWDNYPLDHTWVYLYEAIREGKEYPVSNEDALKVMQTLCEIREKGKRTEF